MKAFLAWIDRRTSGRSALLLTVLFAAAFVLINGRPFGTAQVQAVSGGAGIIDTLVNYTPEQVYAVFEAQGPAGRAAYRTMLLADLGFPLFYASFMAVGLNLLLRSLFSRQAGLRYAVLLPLLGGVFDWAENISVLVMLGNYPQQMNGLASAANLFTLIKFACFSLSLAGLGILGVLWLIRQMRGSRK